MTQDYFWWDEISNESGTWPFLTDNCQIWQNVIYIANSSTGISGVVTLKHDWWKLMADMSYWMWLMLLLYNSQCISKWWIALSCDLWLWPKLQNIGKDVKVINIVKQTVHISNLGIIVPIKIPWNINNRYSVRFERTVSFVLNALANINVN